MLPWPRIFPYRHEFHAAALRPKQNSALDFLASWLKHSDYTQLAYHSNKYSSLLFFHRRTSTRRGGLSIDHEVVIRRCGEVKPQMIYLH